MMDIGTAVSMARLYPIGCPEATPASNALLLSRPHINDLAFEDFERLLDQRIILEIVFVEGNRSSFLLRWRHGSSPGSRDGGRRFRRGGFRRHGNRRRRGGGNWAGGRLGFDEFDLGIGMA